MRALVEGRKAFSGLAICHSFASRALALGETLPVIGKLLGHSDMETTARYGTRRLGAQVPEEQSKSKNMV